MEADLHKNNYLDPKTSQFAMLDHAKQVVLKDVPDTSHVYLALLCLLKYFNT